MWLSGAVLLPVSTLSILGCFHMGCAFTKGGRVSKEILLLATNFAARCACFMISIIIGGRLCQRVFVSASPCAHTCVHVCWFGLVVMMLKLGRGGVKEAFRLKHSPSFGRIFFSTHQV